MSDTYEALREALADTYELVEVLGAGGMGTVYLARDRKHGRQVALKTIHPELATTQVSDRFEREIQITANFQHPHILPLLDSGLAGDTLYYVMPYVEGESLRERIDTDAPLPEREVREIGRQIGAALEYAHERELVHRDIKPENILLAGGQAVLADFGISKAVGESAETALTRSGAMVGTPAYMAPEQFGGEVTGQTDIYALGAVLYEAATGKRWLVGATTEQADWGEVGTELRSALSGALDPAPESRWKDAGALCRALEPEGVVYRGVLHALRQRSLWQVLVGYGVGSWLVLLLADLLTRVIGLPSWFGPAVLVVLALGLPVLVLTSVAQSWRESVRPDQRGMLRYLTWRHAILGGAGAFALLGAGTGSYLAMRSLGIGPAATLIAQGRLEERTEIVLASFLNETRDTLLGPALGRALRIDLGQSPVVRVVAAERVAGVLDRMEVEPETKLDLALAREVAFREQIGAVLAPAISRVGTGYVLSAELFSADGELLLSARETAADSTEILVGLDRLSKGLRERIGEPLRSIGASTFIWRSTTSNLEALKKLVAAGRAHYTLDPDSLKLIEEAIALDSTFAAAWFFYGMTLRGMGERDRGSEALTRAFELRDRATDRERYYIEGFYYANVTDEKEKAIQAFRDYLALVDDNTYYGSVAALAVMGNIYARLRQFVRAEATYKEAVENAQLSGSVPDYENHIANLAMVQANLGKYDEARGTLLAPVARSEAAGDTMPATWNFGLGRIASAAGDYETAEEHFVALRERLPNNPTWRLRATDGLTAVLALRGRLDDARELTDATLAAFEERGLSAWYVSRAILRAGLSLDVRADTVGALANVEAAFARFPWDELPIADRPYHTLADFLARAGETPRARALLEELERDLESEPHPHAKIRGEIALAEGDYEDAAEQFRQADADLSQFCLICALPGLARADDRAGQADSAIATYERYVTTPFISRVYQDQYFLAPTHERLGQLYDERGDVENALRNYAKFVELWQDADPNLQPRVQAAQARLEEILAERG
jgi:tetratricopeptide (TPR) repeat protein